MEEQNEKSQVINTEPLECPICHTICKGPLALHTHKKYYHSSAETPLFRGKRPNRFPLASELKNALENSISINDAAKLIGVTYLTFRKWCNILIPLEYEEFKKTNGKLARHKPKKKRINYPYYKKIIGILEGTIPPPKKWNKLRFFKMLLREGLIEEKCHLCGFEERRVSDYKIPLLLDEINGEKDWRRENIRLLCYNCFFLNVRSLYPSERHHWNKLI